MTAELTVFDHQGTGGTEATYTLISDPDLRPDERFRAVSELISVPTTTPENSYHMTIHVHWVYACQRKQEAVLDMGIDAKRWNNSLTPAHVGSCSVMKCSLPEQQLLAYTTRSAMLVTHYPC